VCVKAELPALAWQDAETRLSRFEGTSIPGPFDPAVLHQAPRTARPLLTESEFQQLHRFCRENVMLGLRGAVPHYYLPGVADGMVNGAAISIRLPRGPQRHFSRLSLRPPMPLQATLCNVSEEAAHALVSQGVDPAEASQVGVELTILDDPAMHGVSSDPDLRGLDTEQRALLLRAFGKSAWLLDPAQSAESLLRQNVASLELHGAPAAVYSLRARASRAPVHVVDVPHPAAGTAVRPPAVAGLFYPGEPHQLAAMVGQLMPSDRAAVELWHAVLVPHAGLTYSGRIAARVLSQVELPDTVIVIGPKHSRAGVDYAVAPNQAWALPGTQVASHVELARDLARSVPLLELDAQAHQREHAIEVELPLLHHLAPQARVVGIAIGPASLEQCRQIGQGLAAVLGRRAERSLLVISSDMNHFASDAENRRLDQMALQALDTCDPELVYETVRQNGISMCGVLPAVIVLEALRRRQGQRESRRVAYATSADATGDTSRVVGYAGMLFR
jgi:AmmeMemoRadiSam system protein B